MRHTPVTWPRADLSGADPAKGMRFGLKLGGTEIPLSRGEVLLGRSRSCQVVVDDMLVSRHHARFLVSRGALFVDDLGSTNGVIVNELPIAGPTPLGDGDRLIVGTQEIFVLAAASEEQAPEGGFGREVEPRSRQQTLPVQSPVSISSRPPPSPPSAAKRAHPGLEPDPAQRTEKQDGLATMARMADRMISMGRHEAAVRLLADHLRGALARAREGEAMPPAVLDIVGLHGLKLAEVTHEGEWANVAVELHLLCQRVLPPRAVGSLEALHPRVPSLDRNLIARYQSKLRDLALRADPDQRTLIDRILALPIV